MPTAVSLIDPVQRPHVPKSIPAYMFGGKVRCSTRDRPRPQRAAISYAGVHGSMRVRGAHAVGGSQALNLAFNAVFDVHYGYIGEAHFKAMMRILGRRYLAVLVGELANNFHQLVRRFPQPLGTPLGCTSNHSPAGVVWVAYGHAWAPSRPPPPLLHGQLKTGMSQYMAALMRGMPVKTDLPLMSYGMEGP